MLFFSFLRRMFTFCSQHKSRSINLITLFAWLLPLIVFTIYFSSIKCQGMARKKANISIKRIRLKRLFMFGRPSSALFFFLINSIGGHWLLQLQIDNNQIRFLRLSTCFVSSVDRQRVSNDFQFATIKQTNPGKSSSNQIARCLED